MMLVAHFLGSIFYFISKSVYLSGNNSWIEAKRLDNLDWEEKYLETLYFSVITMVTVGYGDNAPVASKEKVFVIMMASFSGVFYAFFINSVNQMITELANLRATYE